MADPIVVPAVVKQLLIPFAKGFLGGSDGPSPAQVLESSPAWNDAGELAAERDRIARLPYDKGRLPWEKTGRSPAARAQQNLLKRIDKRLEQLEPGESVPPSSPPPADDVLPGDPDSDYQEQYEEFLADQDAEFDQPWFESSSDPTADPGDVDRRAVERELRINQDVAPYAVEYYRSQFVDDRPRVPDRVPTRAPGRLGTAGAMVTGIIELIKLGRSIFGEPEVAPTPKGPGTRPPGRVKTAPPPEPELEEIRVDQQRRRVETEQTQRVKLEQKTATAPELEEIKVTARRRAAPPRARAPAKAGSLILDLKDLLSLYSLVRSARGSKSTGSARVPERVDQVDRVRVEQTLAQPTTTRTRTTEKKCAKEKEQRVRCFKGFYRETKSATRKRKWQQIDCTTGKEIRNG